jgi:hypothetical protein
MSGSAFPVGLCMLQVIRLAISQPSTTSWILAFSSWCLSGACCSQRGVVRVAELQGLREYLYTLRYGYIPLLRFTAHALLAEMPREGCGRRRGLPLPDLCDAEGETTARPRRPSLGLRTWAAGPRLSAHTSTSSDAVVLGSAVRRRPPVRARTSMRLVPGSSMRPPR